LSLLRSLCNHPITRQKLLPLCPIADRNYLPQSEYVLLVLLVLVVVLTVPSFFASAFLASDKLLVIRPMAVTAPGLTFTLFLGWLAVLLVCAETGTAVMNTIAKITNKDKIFFILPPPVLSGRPRSL